MRLIFVNLIIFIFWSHTVAAQAPDASQPGLDVYGSVPSVRSAAISDDGQKVALLKNDEDGEYVLVRDFATRQQSGFRIEGFKPISVDFIGDRYVILRASATETLFNVIGKFEFGFSFIYDTEAETIEQLLRSVKGVLPGSDASRIIGVLEESGEFLVPALTFPAMNSAVNSGRAGVGGFGSTVFRVKPDTGRVRVFEGDRQSARLGSGSRAKYPYTTDWVVSSSGAIIAREDYNQYDNVYRIFTKAGGSWKRIYSNDPEDSRFVGGVPYNVVGMTMAEDAVLLTGINAAFDETVLYSLDFEGNLSEPLFEKEGRDVARVLSDDNRRVFGVEFSGLNAEYAFFDPDLEASFGELQQRMEGFQLVIVDWNEDLRRLLLKVSGGGETGSYFIFDVETGRLISVAKAYDIPTAWVGQMQSVEYRASDGMMIPSIVTWPVGSAADQLPLIVLPHGGPHANDVLRFDWMAQYFSSRGYLVFQPNFRGSSGFGHQFEAAGYGEWGQAMQRDIHEGVAALVSLGWVDPDRVCIVGASYGGYAALAGGMTAPDMYKCVVAIAPVTDLPDFLSHVRQRTGSRGYAYEYWTTSIGELGADGEILRATSPARNAEAFQAPVLLVHGRDDTIVPLAQSRKMKSALEAADRSVQLLEFAGTDHWLSTTEMRLQTLQAVADFVDTHLSESE
ncbi:MAG: alpha/beta fold hydrolase [Pseudomonadota bacterium]